MKTTKIIINKSNIVELYNKLDEFRKEDFNCYYGAYEGKEDDFFKEAKEFISNLESFVVPAKKRVVIVKNFNYGFQHDIDFFRSHVLKLKIKTGELFWCYKNVMI